MSIVKTKIEQGFVLNFLKETFNEAISEIVFLKGGEASQAFSFHSNDEDFVVRINAGSESFKKDAYVAEYFGSKNIPIPAIVEMGKFDEKYFYAISKQAKGKTVDFFTENEYQKILPKMLEVLDYIHATDIRDTSGYGKWDFDGIGEFDSWREYILAVDFYVKENDYFKKTFFEKDVWDKIYSELERLAEYCPEERYLVHGGYSSGNVLSDGKEITGVIDWDSSLYGDFLYDIAWLSFWTDKQDGEKFAENLYRKMELPDFEERLLCYKLRIGLGSLSFYAYSKQEDKYNLIKKRILLLIKK